MAKLAPGCYPTGVEEKQDDESWDAYIERQDALYDKLTEKSNSLPEGEVVGAFIRFQIADGYANYVVTKVKPLTLQYVRLGDGYQVAAAHIRGLRKSDILEMVRREKNLTSIFGRKPKTV